MPAIVGAEFLGSPTELCYVARKFGPSRTKLERFTPCRAARVPTGSVPARARTAIILQIGDQHALFPFAIRNVCASIRARTRR